jgi:hypothetical protein
MKFQGCGNLQGNAVTSMPEIIQIAVNPTNASAVYLGTVPGSIFLMRRQTDIRLQPMLAM